MMEVIFKGETGVLVKQRIKTNIFWVIAVAMAAAVVAVIFFASSQVSAQTSDKSASNNVLKISPVRSDIQIIKGASKVLKVTLTNVSNTPITLKAVANDFIAGDESGTPALILDENEFAPTHSLKRFMKPVPNITIPPKQSKTVDVNIVVPESAQAGGYFGAIRFAPTDPAGGGQINLSSSVASLILLTVPGPVVEKLDLTEFNIQQNGKTNWYFQSPNDLNLTWRFKSSSNVQLGPIGKISVKNGDKVVYEYDFNNKPLRDMVLPDSARRWNIPLKNIESFGHYTVYATFTYGSKNESINIEKSFWVIPTTVIIATVVGVLVLIALIVGIVMFLRSYKRKILSSQSRRGRR